MSSMTFLIRDPVAGAKSPVVRVTITANADGTATFVIQQQPGYTGDLRGLFFDLGDESLIGSLSARGSGLSQLQQGNDTVKDLGQGANMQGALGGDGGFDVGLEFGTSGIGKGDDWREVSFTLASNQRALTLADFSKVDFGVRLTSVGLDANGDGVFESARTGGAKLVGQSLSVVTPTADAAQVQEDASTSGNVLANDGGGAGTLMVTAWSGGSLGAAVAFADLHGATVLLRADGSYVVDASAADALSAGQTVSRTFTYTVSQSDG